MDNPASPVRSDKPVLFSGPTVRALIREALESGTGKTQHRVPLKLPTKGQYVHPKMGGWAPCTNGGGGCFRFGRRGERIPVPETIGIWHQTTGYCMDAPYQVGMRLWVREAFATGSPDHLWGPTVYKATHAAMAPVCEGFTPWRSATQMRRDLSRLTLIVTDVRVERLNDISEVDAEGCEFELWDQTLAVRDYSKPNAWFQMWDEGCGGTYVDHAEIWRASYRTLWNSLHGPDAWQQNPWVCAVMFRPILANINALPASQEDADVG